MKKRVLLRAPLLTNSGYGVHSRQIFEWLEGRKEFDITTQCLMWGQTPWLINPSTENGLIGRIMSAAQEPQSKFDITFQVQLPDEWDTSLGHINVGVTALVETDRCNYTWLEKIEKMDAVIVPSVFTKNVIINSFGKRFDKKVQVVPEWFNECLTYKKDKLERVKDERYKFDTKFNLLTVGTLTSTHQDSDRKNLINTLKWAIETFEGNEDVGIVVKTCLGRGSISDRETTLTGLESVVSAFRKSEFPKIHVIHGNMTKLEVAALFRSNKIHGYISATRGEGYGLPLIEAAAASLPIVTTNWSGHLDFLGESFIKVDYDMKEVSENRIDNRIFIKGAKWAEPKRESYVEGLIDLRENYQNHLQTSRKLKKQVENRFSKKKVCKKYDKFLREAFNL